MDAQSSDLVIVRFSPPIEPPFPLPNIPRHVPQNIPPGYRLTATPRFPGTNLETEPRYQRFLTTLEYHGIFPADWTGYPLLTTCLCLALWSDAFRLIQELQVLVKPYRIIQQITGDAMSTRCRSLLLGGYGDHSAYNLMVGGRMTTLHELSDPNIQGLLMIFLQDEQDQRKPVVLLVQGPNALGLQEQVLYAKRTTREYPWFTSKGDPVNSSALHQTWAGYELFCRPGLLRGFSVHSRAEVVKYLGKYFEFAKRHGLRIRCIMEFQSQ